MKVHIDTKGYCNKPTDAISVIKPRLQSNNTLTDLSLTDLIHKIKQGYSISPGVMRDGAKAKNWIEQRIFMVDIDNDADEKLARKLKIDVSQLSQEQRTPIQSVEQALQICTENRLQPAFYYYSFSHTDQKPKYRLCFVMDEVVTAPYKRALIIETLINLFNQSDTSCNNADRLFYGTNKEVVVVNLEAIISFESILNASKPQPGQVYMLENKENTELNQLKKEFDFFSYLKQRNGDTVFNNSKCAMFLHCELCGHKKDLVFYHETNSFMCFGANCHRGGSIIDYLMISQRMNRNEAIKHFLYEICQLKRSNYINLQRQEQISRLIDLNLIDRLQELQPHIKYSFNDKGFGELFADIYKDNARYNVTAKEWYFYNGKVWIEDTGSMQVSQKAKELVDGLLIYATTIPDDHLKKAYLDYVTKFGQYRYREIMIKDARDKYFINQQDLDKNLDLFNCQNGTLNLRTFEFTSHNPEDLLSKISNVIYDPEAHSPLFDQFIDDILQGNLEKTAYLQKILGYSLSADTSLETCFIFYGATTRNGKSTLIETMSYMMGNTAGYALAMQPQTLALKQNKDSRQANGDIARLSGCRFLSASEPPKKMIFDVALLKTLLGRDTIIARNLYEREFEFVPHFKLFINTNFLPLIADDSLFTSGRINVITFDRHFEPSEQDRTLKQRLRLTDNISGIFNWCLDGLRLFYEYGAEPPQTICDSTAEYRVNSDKIGNFINECLEKTGENSRANDVYSIYRIWCEANGFGVENKSNFYDEIRGKNLLAKNRTVNGRTESNVIMGYSIVYQSPNF